MKILLVRPNLSKKVTTMLKEQGHEVLLLDFMAESKRNFKKYIEQHNPDIIGFTLKCKDISNVLIMTKEVKQINKKIIVLSGGVQVIITPQAYFDENIDYVFKSTTRENLLLMVVEITVL